MLWAEVEARLVWSENRRRPECLGPQASEVARGRNTGGPETSDDGEKQTIMGDILEVEPKECADGVGGLVRERRTEHNA